MTDYPRITVIPQPPQRGQDDEVFVRLADAFMAALPQFAVELNAFGAALVAATIERVVNEAAASYAGAIEARDGAIAARNAAQASAASIDPATFVKLIGAQNIDGAKTFAQKIVASLGIRINGQDLTALTAAGKALIEAADVAAQKSILGVGAVEAVGGVGAVVTAASNALPVNSYIAFGTTVAGSSLETCFSVQTRVSLGGAAVDGGPTPGVGPNSGANAISLGLSGTWRLQTTLYTGASGDFRPVGLWKRIA